jgi:hypothetical protein
MSSELVRKRASRARIGMSVSKSRGHRLSSAALISSNEVGTSPELLETPGVVEQDLRDPWQAVRHRRVPMVHRASEVLVEDEGYAARFAEASVSARTPAAGTTASARSGDCAGSLRFPLAVALKPTCEAVESGRRPDAAKAARRVPREDRPLTGRGANLGFRAGSVNGLTAVDVEDMAGDV